MADNWLFRLEGLGKEFNDVVGKKCANLGEMAKIGLPVPYGFALSTQAYKIFLTSTGATDEIEACVNNKRVAPEDVRGIHELSLAIRQIVESKRIPEDMALRILAEYDELGKKAGLPDVPVSTRSAGTVSHPGQYETYLNVKGKAELLKKIRLVWASTFNPRSISFRLVKGLPLSSEPIGVAVLTMVQARSAGIAFSADPNTGDLGKVIVEANWGLGESVVSGELMPDRWVVDKESLRILTRTMGKKETAVVGTSAGVTWEKLPEEKARSFCLSDDEVQTIAGLANRLEAHFGAPQDIEWAVSTESKSERIVLLQARNVVIAKKSATDQVIDIMINLLKIA